MRITDVPTYTASDLPYATTNVSTEMFGLVGAAVQACVGLDDPLASLADPVHGLNHKYRLHKAVEWLTANAPFDIEVIKRAPVGIAGYFLAELRGHPYAAWLHNVGALAAKHIDAFYLQGRWVGNEHPVFKLVYEYVSDESSLDYYNYQPKMLDETHWSLFVRAVVVQERLDSASTKNIAWAKAVIVGIVDLLAKRYPVLGRRDGISYATCSIDPDEVAKLWAENIAKAAKTYGESLRVR